jgi:hypothetical protein
MEMLFVRCSYGQQLVIAAMESGTNGNAGKINSNMAKALLASLPTVRATFTTINMSKHQKATATAEPLRKPPQRLNSASLDPR